MKKIILNTVLLASTALFSTAQAESPIVNGSFEMDAVDSFNGGYYGWTLQQDHTPGVGTWGIAAHGDTINVEDVTLDYTYGEYVTQDSFGLPHTYTSTDGDFVAYQLQTQFGIATYKMYQDIEVCPQAEDLIWDMEYNRLEYVVPGLSLGEDFTPLHFTAVEFYAIESDGDTSTLLDTLFQTISGDPQTIQMTEITADITGFAGQTVRLMVTQQIDDFYIDATWDNFRIPSCESNAINYLAEGFESPAIGTIAVKKNRTLPLKATITNEGVPVTADDLMAAPIVQVLFSELNVDPEDVVDVSDDALASGQGTEGNQFVYIDDGKWQLNLKIKNYTAPGAYTVTMQSGDESEYTFTPIPTVTFVVQ